MILSMNTSTVRVVDGFYCICNGKEIARQFSTKRELMDFIHNWLNTRKTVDDNCLIRCNETNETFNTYSEASKATGVMASVISRQCKGYLMDNCNFHFEKVMIA